MFYLIGVYIHFVGITTVVVGSLSWVDCTCGSFVSMHTTCTIDNCDVVYGKNQDTEFIMCFILLPKYGMMQHASDDLIEEVSCTNIARTHGHVIYVIHVPLHQDTFHLT